MPFHTYTLSKTKRPLVDSTCQASLQPRASNQAHGFRSPGPRDALYATTEVEPVTVSASTPGISVVTSLDFSCVATSSMAELSDAILSARSCAEAAHVACRKPWKVLFTTLQTLAQTPYVECMIRWD